MNRNGRTWETVCVFIGKATLTAVAYFLFGLLGYLFINPDTSLPLIWPQAGLAIAISLVAGFETLPGIFIGSFILAIVTGVPFGFSAIVAAGNTLAACFPAYLLLVKNNFHPSLEDNRSILKLFLLGVIISPMIAATVSLLGMALAGLPAVEDFPVFWGDRWMRDALGALIFAPLLVVWLGNPLPRLGKRNLPEGLAIIASGIALESLIFFGRFRPDTAISITFFLIPVIIWASFRLKIHGLVTANSLISGFFLWASVHHAGALFADIIPANLTFLIVLATLWVTSLVLSASLTKYYQVQQSLSDLSNHDTLTGLYNRLFFETELKRLDNSRQFPISILMTDMDDLKQVNDNFGHRAGDQLLKNLASLFASIFRHEDIICRIGGDEFVILLPNTGEPETKIILDRLNKRIEVFNQDHPDLPIRISTGVSTASQGESLGGHLKIADNLMYEEKNRKKAEESISLFIPDNPRVHRE